MLKNTGGLINDIVAGLRLLFLEATRRTMKARKNTLIMNPFKLFGIR
ncbi:MAG: hypothetical protein QW604_04130 [Fervidicoccaceae archaeon]